MYLLRLVPLLLLFEALDHAVFEELVEFLFHVLEYSWSYCLHNAVHIKCVTNNV